MGIDIELQGRVNWLARQKFEGSEHLWRRVNVFSPEDLAQDFWASDKFKEGKDPRLSYSDFEQYISNQIRRAKTLDRNQSRIH